MIYCLDTSAINRLLDDPEREPIIRGVLSAGSFRITAYNVIEAEKNMGSKTWGQVFHYHISALLAAHCYVVYAKMSGYCHHAYLISDRHKSAESTH